MSWKFVVYSNEELDFKSLGVEATLLKTNRVGIDFKGNQKEKFSGMYEYLRIGARVFMDKEIDLVDSILKFAYKGKTEQHPRELMPKFKGAIFPFFSSKDECYDLYSYASSEICLDIFSYSWWEGSHHLHLEWDEKTIELFEEYFPDRNPIILSRSEPHRNEGSNSEARATEALKEALRCFEKYQILIPTKQQMAELVNTQN